MSLVQTNLRQSDTNKPEVFTFSPEGSQLMGFTTSIRANSIGNTVVDPRSVSRMGVQGVRGTDLSGQVYLR